MKYHMVHNKPICTTAYAYICNAYNSGIIQKKQLMDFSKN